MPAPSSVWNFYFWWKYHFLRPRSTQKLKFSSKFEIFAKIGIPAGVFSNDPLPTHVEALYAQEVSKELALEALAAAKGFFLGKHHNTNQQGPSFKAYLDFLNTIKNGEDLSSLIVEQFNAANAEMSSLNPNFAVQIQSNNSAMLQTYDALQRNVILLKVDMLQALSIDVDFVDTDGD